MLPEKTYSDVIKALDVAIDAIREHRLTDDEDARLFDHLLSLGMRFAKRAERAQALERRKRKLG